MTYMGFSSSLVWNKQEKGFRDCRNPLLLIKVYWILFKLCFSAICYAKKKKEKKKETIAPLRP